MKQKAEHLEKPPFVVTFCTDKPKEQWERDVDVDGTTKEFSTDEDKMDREIAGYEQERCDEILNEMNSTMTKIGSKLELVENNTPVLPVTGWMTMCYICQCFLVQDQFSN